MRTKRARLNIVVSALFLSLSACCAYAAPAGSSASTAAPKLADEVKLDSFSIQPPPGLTLTQPGNSSPSDAAALFTWQTAARKDSMTGALIVTVSSQLPKDTVQALHDFLDNVIAGRVTNLSHSAIETKDINGSHFAKVYWKGTNPDNPKEKKHGFVYMTTYSLNTYTLASEDAEPSSQISLPIAESSVLTFKPIEQPWPEWASDPKFSDELAGKLAFQGLTMRPPTFFEYTRQDDIQGHPTLNWLGKGTVGPSRPQITMFVQQLQNVPSKDQAARDGLKAAISDLYTNYKNAKATPVEHGLINNIRFFRAYYTADAMVGNDPAKLHGFLYATYTKSSLVILSGVDCEPDSFDILPILEASALTFNNQ